jgi:cell shape-determining protein MreC
VFQLRFNQVFFALMALSFLSAFVAPARLTELQRVPLEGLLVPISRPTYHIATWLRGRLVRTPPEDSRSFDAIRQENLELRQEISRLQMEVERLGALAAERQNLGDLKSLCDRFPVAGTDSGDRDGLILSGISAAVKEQQPVLYGGGLAGTVDRAGEGVAHVRLVTDAGFVVSGQFVRFVKQPDGTVQVVRVSQLLPIVQGAGGGQMVIANLPLQDVTSAQLQPDDWVVLSDNTWPAAIQGIRVGRIASIKRAQRAALFAEIKLEPESGLMRLGDVWVMTRNP